MDWSEKYIRTHRKRYTKPRSRTSLWLSSAEVRGICSSLYTAFTDLFKGVACVAQHLPQVGQGKVGRKNKSTLEISDHRYPQIHLIAPSQPLCEPHRCLTGTWVSQVFQLYVRVDVRTLVVSVKEYKSTVLLRTYTKFTFTTAVSFGSGQQKLYCSFCIWIMTIQELQNMLVCAFIYCRYVSNLFYKSHICLNTWFRDTQHCKYCNKTWLFCSHNYRE